MSDADFARKLDELDRLLNDPDVPMQPDRIWSLLADVSRPDVAGLRMAPGSGVHHGTES
ncbi:MAG TPA: peptide chain release factor 1 [Rhodopila sp.]|nr:peptide chain release factor 1 [Rhodopila sp.]